MVLEKIQTFANPEEFLRQVQETLAWPHSKDIPTYESILRFHFRQILSAVPSVTTDRIALGCLVSPEINAAILKSPDNHHAIVVNFGLCIMINRMVKLLSALRDVRTVVKCDRKPPQEVTTEDIHVWICELIDTYKKTSVPKGVSIQLSFDAQGTQTLFVHIAESFVICHELGHYLNGDLEDSTAYGSFMGLDWVQKYEENRSHQIEYAADLRGYDLLCSQFQKHHPYVKPTHLLLGINFLFDLLDILGFEGSGSHPHPVDRVIRVVNRFYGPEIAQELERTYSDGSPMANVIEQMQK